MADLTDFNEIRLIRQVFVRNERIWEKSVALPREIQQCEQIL